MVAVARVDGGHRLVGEGSLVEFANRWLGHLEGRQFSPATVRSYAFDVVCLARFFDEAAIDWRQANPTDFFDWLEWQCRPAATEGQQSTGRPPRREARLGGCAHQPAAREPTSSSSDPTPHSNSKRGASSSWSPISFRPSCLTEGTPPGSAWSPGTLAVNAGRWREGCCSSNSERRSAGR